MEKQIVCICRKPYFSISAVQGTSAICLEGSVGNYKRVLGGLKGKGLKCVGNWALLVLLLMAEHSSFQPLLSHPGNNPEQWLLSSRQIFELYCSVS